MRLTAVAHESSDIKADDWNNEVEMNLLAQFWLNFNLVSDIIILKNFNGDTLLFCYAPFLSLSLSRVFFHQAFHLSAIIFLVSFLFWNRAIYYYLYSYISDKTSL